MRPAARAVRDWLRRQSPPRWRLPGGLRPWITCASLGFLLAAMLSHGRQLRQYHLDLQGWLWLVLGLGFCLLSLVVSGLAWGVILRWLGWRPRPIPVVTLYLVTNLRKFLPGGIWHLASRVQVLRQPNGVFGGAMGTRTALLAVLIEPLLAATAALALVSLGGWQGGLGALALAPLALLVPRWLNPLLLRLERGKAARLGLTEVSAPLAEVPSVEAPLAAVPLAAVPFGEAPLGEASAAGSIPLEEGASGTDRGAPPADPIAAPWTGQVTTYPWAPLLAQLVFVLVRFAGFACCVWAFDLQETVAWTNWLVGFALAWTLGLVVPGAPGGLGVFEAVLLLRLSLVLPEPAVLAVALSYRLVVTIADLLAAGLAGLDGKLAGPSASWALPTDPLATPPSPALDGPTTP